MLLLEKEFDVKALTEIATDKGKTVEILRTYYFDDVSIVTVKTRDISVFDGVKGIKSVGRNYIYRALATPNDALSQIPVTLREHKTAEVRDIIKSANVVVAVIDTSVSLTHPDLQGIFE